MSHFRLQLSEPAVGPPKNLGSSALVAAILGDGAAFNRPFHTVQEFGERAALFDGIKQGSPFDRKRFLELVSPPLTGQHRSRSGLEVWHLE